MKKTGMLAMTFLSVIILITGCNKGNSSSGEESIALQQKKSYCGSLAVHSEEAGDYNKIYYFDYNSGRIVYACGQANCSHNEADYLQGKINCNAIIDGDVQYPFIYNRNLYYFICDTNSSVLWKSKTDGTEKEKIAELDYEINYCMCVYAKGGIYVTSSDVRVTEGEQNSSYASNARTEVYRIDIESGENKQITDFGEKGDSNIRYIKYFDNKLFISYISSENTYEEAGFENVDDYTSWMTSDDFTYKKDIERFGKTEKCYIYDLDNKKVERMDIDFESNFEPYKGIEDMDSFYVVGYADDTVYYLDPVVGKYAIYSYNLETKERKEVLSSFQTIEEAVGDKIYVTTLSMDESTKDELVPSVDINIEPEYYIIDTKTGNVTKQTYGKTGKIMQVVDENEEGPVAYVKDFDNPYVIFDENSMCVIPEKSVR